MSLITGAELARGLIIGVFGGAAGACTLAFPGSALWLVPAGLAVGGCALTVPEVRGEVARALPAPLQGRTLRQLPAAALARFQDARAAQATRDATRAGPGTAAPADTWLAAVNDRPDDNPHLTVVGPSGSGKTTFVSAALGQRPGRVVVLTPKVSPGAWRGAEVVSLDEDLSYEPIAAALEELKLEARQRAAMLKRGEPLEPLTVVLDELPELHAEIPTAGAFAVRLSRWGRELGMRQVVLATSDDALNIKGWAATRPNYARIELQKPTADGRRRAILDDGQERRTIDLDGLKAKAERARLRPWRGEVAPETPVDPLLAELLATMSPERAARLRNVIPAHQDAEGTGVTPIPGNGSNGGGAGHSSVSVVPGNGTTTVNVTQVAAGPATKDKAARTAYERALAEVYRAAGAEGLTFAKVYAQHKGTKEIVFTAWQEGRATRGE